MAACHLHSSIRSHRPQQAGQERGVCSSGYPSVGKPLPYHHTLPKCAGGVATQFSVVFGTAAAPVGEQGMSCPGGLLLTKAKPILFGETRYTHCSMGSSARQNVPFQSPGPISPWYISVAPLAGGLGQPSPALNPADVAAAPGIAARICRMHLQIGRG